MSVVIVDTGCANLASVGFAFDRLGIANTTTQDTDMIRNANRIIVPGVGSAAYAMQSLQARGLVKILKNLTMPVLGICLGMQLLLESSAEGNVQGLGLLEGKNHRTRHGEPPKPTHGMEYFGKPCC